MQLWACLVDWGRAVEEHRQSGESMSLSDESWCMDVTDEVLGGDSVVLNEEVSHIVEAAMAHMPAHEAMQLDRFVSAFLVGLDSGRGYRPPKDLVQGSHDVIVASFAPTTVEAFLSHHTGVDYTQLRRAIERHVSIAGCEAVRSADDVQDYIAMACPSFMYQCK